jgi:uncharacterized membrane protein HdeD (DUF308 family)
MAGEVGKFWWLWLIAGALWIIIGMVVLQFETASVTTVGVIIGIMFIVAGIQYLAVGAIVEGWKWLWFTFGVLLLIAGFYSVFNPTRTFVAVADILGFVFALVGIIWLIEAFVSRESNDLWWLTLIAGIVMLLMGIWLGSQLFLTKAYTLLVFTGIWAVLKGIIDVVLAFQVRKFGKISTGA